MRKLGCVVATALAAVCGLSAQQPIVHYESGQVHPLRLSPDGTRLFVADTLGGRLCVFNLSDPDTPFLTDEIPVGLEPVSVHPRTRDEVWVANQVSDTVSIVSVPDRRVIDTLRVVDEPSDIVFAGGKAFVSAATRDEIHVFDAVTRAPLGTVAVFGKDPRALAVSHDGTRVFAVIQRSGNGTTIVPAMPPPTPPLALPPLPAEPDQGLIVFHDDPVWAAATPHDLPDNDVAEIDVASLTVNRYFAAVGTTNTGIAVHPTSGDIWVANTDARNWVRFEPALRAHAIDSRLTRITTGATPVITPFDLNVGINYTAPLPDTAALSTALAEPFGVAIDPVNGLVYVAAHGSDRIGVVDLNGNVVASIEAGNASGATIDTRNKRGPRGLALHPSTRLLYVLNRLSDTLLVVDTQAQTVLLEQPIASHDPMDPAMREARNFLYDSKLSGNGTMSCASCHVDADMDGLAWDLGDPAGQLQPAPLPPPVVYFHPMKGPMVTQTLRGLAGTEPLHWRGDRADFQAFNGAFASLMGGSQLSTGDMNDFAAFALTIAYPPNPNQQLDRSWLTGTGAFPFALHQCFVCHDHTNGGTSGAIFAGLRPQLMKVAQLRNLYRKVGFERTPGPKKSGFGFEHDGADGTLAEFLSDPFFAGVSAQHKLDLEVFLMGFDTGTAPAVGYQVQLTSSSAFSAPFAADIALLKSRAAAGDLDVTAHGEVDGRLAGLLYRPVTDDFESDLASQGPFTLLQLQQKATGVGGSAALTFTAVNPNQGHRVALDRDLDGSQNGKEAAAVYGAGTFYGVGSPGCAGMWTVRTNSEPKLANELFGFVIEGAPPSQLGVIGLSLQQTSQWDSFLAVTILVPSGSQTWGAMTDTFGEAWVALPLDPSIFNLGDRFFGQALWVDPCAGPGGGTFFSSTSGLDVLVVP